MNVCFIREVVFLQHSILVGPLTSDKCQTHMAGWNVARALQLWCQVGVSTELSNLIKFDSSLERIQMYRMGPHFHSQLAICNYEFSDIFQKERILIHIE